MNCMKQTLCRATVIYMGIGKGGKIKCFLTKESGVPATRKAFHATIVVLRKDSIVGKNTNTFDSFEKAQSWLEEHFDDLAIVELQLVSKEKS